MRGQPGFFDVDERLKRLSDLGDQLLAFVGGGRFRDFPARSGGGAGLFGSARRAGDRRSIR